MDERENEERLRDVPRPKRTAKDSVFGAICADKVLLKEVYLTLNPEDTEVRYEDLELIRLNSVLIKGVINDLAILVRGRDLYLVEAQSTLCPNITYRINYYYLMICMDRIVDYHFLQYDEVPFTQKLIPHFTVIYTGRKKPPEYYDTVITLPGQEDYHIRAKVLTKKNSSGIILEYAMFCDVLDSRIRKFGPVNEAVVETIEYCMEKGILTRLLSQHKSEVEAIMYANNEQLYVTLGYGDVREKKGLTKGRAEGRTEGITIGRAEGRNEQRKEDLREFSNLLSQHGVSDEQAGKILAALHKNC